MNQIEDTGYIVSIPHTYKVDINLEFMPPGLNTIQVDMVLIEKVRFDHMDGDTLTPFPDSSAYGHGAHLEDETLEDDDLSYFGSISNQWYHFITAPMNIVVGQSPEGQTYQLAHEMNMTRPFGTDFDYESGACKDNPDTFVDKIIYCDEDDSDYSMQNIPKELGGEPEIRHSYVQRMAEMFGQAIANRTDLVFMHPKADQAYRAYLYRKQQRQNMRHLPKAELPQEKAQRIAPWIQ